MVLVVNQMFTQSPTTNGCVPLVVIVATQEAGQPVTAVLVIAIALVMFSPGWKRPPTHRTLVNVLELPGSPKNAHTSRVLQTRSLPYATMRTSDWRTETRP